MTGHGYANLKVLPRNESSGMYERCVPFNTISRNYIVAKIGENANLSSLMFFVNFYTNCELNSGNIYFYKAIKVVPLDL